MPGKAQVEASKDEVALDSTLLGKPNVFVGQTGRVVGQTERGHAKCFFVAGITKITAMSLDAARMLNSFPRKARKPDVH